jgi:pimeloyl-ACP methyl ester carboxylesterase
MYFVLWIASVVATLILAGVLYQCIGSWRDRRLYTHAGRLVTIGRGCKLYLLEEGSGVPTVLFEAGIGATSLNWCNIQEAVAQFTGTASYDRSGLGWSSPCRTARTPGNVARELHELLRCAQLKPPYVLVGHSFGGLVMRRYALLYPEDVAGIVLVDPMRCEEWPPLDPGKQSQLNLGIKLIRYAVPIAQCGLARLALTSLFCRSGKLSGWLISAIGPSGRHVMARVTHEMGKIPKKIWPMVVAHWSKPYFYVGLREHIASIPETVKEMDAAEPIRGIPVTVLTPGKSTPLTEECLRRIGNHVQQKIAPASTHWIHLDEPALVIDAIRSMVDAVTPETVAAVR